MTFGRQETHEELRAKVEHWPERIEGQGIRLVFSCFFVYFVYFVFKHLGPFTSPI